MTGNMHGTCSKCTRDPFTHMQVESALEAEVNARATELVDVSVDISRLGQAVKGLHSRALSIRGTVEANAQAKLWERDQLQLLKARKARWKEMQQVREAPRGLGSGCSARGQCRAL